VRHVGCRLSAFAGGALCRPRLSRGRLLAGRLEQLYGVVPTVAFCLSHPRERNGTFPRVAWAVHRARMDAPTGSPGSLHAAVIRASCQNSLRELVSCRVVLDPVCTCTSRRRRRQRERGNRQAVLAPSPALFDNDGICSAQARHQRRAPRRNRHGLRLSWVLHGHRPALTALNG